MMSKILATLISLFLITSCNRSGTNTSTFFGGFDPVVTLNKVGGGTGIAYVNGSRGSSSEGSMFKSTVAQKKWTFSFEGSRAQLAAQLDEFRAETKRQLLSSGAEIPGRGSWEGDFSGFKFDYSSAGRHGFVRVTGVSLENNKQALEIFMYEE
jgi:hypothetical protein